MMKLTIIQELNERAINDKYLYKLLKKIQYIYGAKLFGTTREKLTVKELVDVLRFSDILSRSEKSLNRNISLKIISTLFDDYKDNEIYQLFAQNVMVKLGNFPSLQLLEEAGIEFDNKEIELDKMLKKYFQSTSMPGKFFTDSQYETFNDIVNSNHYSFSAGTSFGKSFLFSEFVNWIIKEKNASENIAFLVPTRALITQVVEDFENSIFDENYRVVSNPDIPALFRNDRFIFVFTPERLVSYFSQQNNPNISTMIIDEAQNTISDDERSPIFYHAITLAEQKSIKLYFASPNVPNPEIFLQLVGNSTDESKHILDVNVVQNKYFIDFVSHKYRIYYDYLADNKSNDFELKEKRFNDLLINMTSNSQSIIYCNAVQNTVEKAQDFSKLIAKSEDNDLIELANYIRETIHDKYYLGKLVERGISFHFGALPQEIRKQIEEFFKRGKIKYLFTTSTLLQGVNLPAKNLFILNDKIGKSNLNEFDFHNLAGRAGRLAKELYGNIFVVRLDEKSSVERLLEFKNVPEIKSQVLSGQGNFYKNVGNVLDDMEMTNKSMPAKKQREIADYAAILTYQHKKNVPSQLVDKFNQRNNDSKRLVKKMTEIEIPEDALMISTMIKPKYQEKVYNLVTPHIFNANFDANSCRQILEILSSAYSWKDEEDKRNLGNSNRLGYYAVLMSEWIQSKPLNVMIQSTINYHEKNKIQIGNDPTKREIFSITNINHINFVINELMKDIENIVKFKIKNYVTNYLKLTNQDDSEWQNYLEYGTSDKTIIELQKIGFDRPVAMELSNQSDENFEINENGEIVGISTENILESSITSEARRQIELFLK